MTSASFDIVCIYCPDEFGACLVWKGGDATPRMPRTMFTSSVKVIFCVLFAASCGFHRSPGSKTMERRARKGMTCMQPTTKIMNVKKTACWFYIYVFGAKSSNTSQHISSNYSCYLSSNPPAGSSQTRSNISAKTSTLTPASCITRTMPGSNTNLETGKRREGWRAGDDWLMGRFIWKYIVMGCYGYIFSKNWE